MTETVSVPIAGENRDLEQMHIPRLFRRMIAYRKHPRIDTWRTSGKRHLQTGERLEQRTLLTANSILTEALVPLSTGTGQISGTLYSDQDANGVQSSSETGLSGWRVFIDDNRNGSLDTGEVFQTTDSTGSYEFTNLPEGQYVLSAEVNSDWEVTTDHAPIGTVDALTRLVTNQQNAQPRSTRDLFNNEHIAEQLIVCFTDSARADEAIMDSVREKQQLYGHQTLNQMQNGLELWSVDAQLTAAYEIWADDPRIAFIEPNYTFSVADTFPNDDRIGNLWGLHNTGQNGGSLDADIDAPEAWDLQTGSGEIVIGVIDSGIDYTHPDLANNIWTNPGEIPGNGIDDDENGYIDDVHGWDFVNDDPDPMDGNGHGTHVAGTIAAAGNNEIGISGVSWNASLMALRFLNDSGNGSSYHAILALEYATMMGADITNNSWIGESYSSAAQFAINQAGNAGSLYIACAGNDRNDNDITPTYPASYLGDNVITVAATTNTDALSSFSNYGANSVDLGAPGSGILSTKPGGGYTTKSGTSMATPHVSGVASLLLSKRGDLTPAEIRSAILSGTDSIPSLEGKTVSEGRLNAFGALMQVAPVNGQFVNVYTSTNAVTQFGIAGSSSAPHQFSKIIDDGESGFTEFGFTSQTGQQVAAAFNGDNHNLRGGTGSASWTFTNLEDGEYRVAATWAHKYENAY
ncbi:MAG: S8 family serine peptidase, partial [Pirellulales bacterium]|nr:S8 family serine peptidase [Pirellulales bacterium]